MKLEEEIYGLVGEELEKVERSLSGQVDGAVPERMKELVERYRGIEYSLGKAREYGEICKKEIKALGRSERWNALALGPDYVVARPY